MFLPPAVLAVLVCEVGVYWLLFRSGHRFWRVVRVVVFVNAASSLFGWLVYPPATALPSPHPMAVVAIRSDESPEDRATAQRVLTERFAMACVLSIIVEGLALLSFRWEFAKQRLAIALVVSNVLSYVVMLGSYLAVTGRL